MYDIKMMIISFSQWLYPWLQEIALAILATVLVIYGDSLNRMLKRQISGMHFIFRTLIFILVCAFGYGAVLVFLAPLLTKWLASVSMIYLSPLVIGVFVALGIAAEKKHRI